MQKLLILVFTFIISCNNSSETKESSKQTGIKASSFLKKVYLKRPNYKMEYYYDWKIDSTDADFDIDGYFTLNSASNNNFISFFIFNTSIDEIEQINAQVKAHLRKTLKNGEVTYFNHWGNYKGRGASIRGKILGIFSGEVRVFACSQENVSFLIASQLINSDKEKDEPGFELIESSFRIKQ